MKGFIETYYRPPFVGLLAFVAVFAANPLLHATVVAMRDIAGDENSFIIYQIAGAAAVAALIYGIKRNTEVGGTIIGFVSGMVLWTVWSSYAFKFNMVSLHMPAMSLTPDAHPRSANLIILQSSIGICCTTLLFFVFNKDTKCNAFRWIQRMCRMNLGDAASAQGRNVCRITFLETVYVVWFCYAVSLFVGDGRFLGYDHPVSHALAIGSGVWGLYLLWRLSKFTRVMAGIRYAIPTKSIVWFAVGEMGPRYKLYDEFWLNPLENQGKILAIVAVFVAMMVAAALVPQRRAKKAAETAA